METDLHQVMIGEFQDVGDKENPTVPRENKYKGFGTRMASRSNTGPEAWKEREQCFQNSKGKCFSSLEF